MIGRISYAPTYRHGNALFLPQLKKKKKKTNKKIKQPKKHNLWNKRIKGRNLKEKKYIFKEHSEV